MATTTVAAVATTTTGEVVEDTIEADITTKDFTGAAVVTTVAVVAVVEAAALEGLQTASEQAQRVAEAV